MGRYVGGGCDSKDGGGGVVILIWWCHYKIIHFWQHIKSVEKLVKVSIDIY